MTGRLSVEGPIVKGKSSFILTGRSTYSDWLLTRLEDPELKANALHAIAQAGGEARNPQRTLPLAIFIAIGGVSTYYFIFTAAVSRPRLLWAITW